MNQVQDINSAIVWKSAYDFSGNNQFDNRKNGVFYWKGFC